MSPFADLLARLLLLLAPAVLLPIALPVLGDRTLLRWRWHAVATIALAVALALPTGTAAALATLPWLALCAWRATLGLRRWRRERSLAAFGEAMALAYPVVGAGWALCAAGGLQPLGFAPAIVLLTAVHFHHAGCTLPFACARAVRHAEATLARATLLGVIAGMPLTATGITCTQLGGPHAIELAAAVLTATFGALAAGVHLLAALDGSLPRRARALLAIAGSALGLAMALALVYALRRELGVFADAPAALATMVAAHGLLNGAVFGPCALLGWRAVRD